MLPLLRLLNALAGAAVRVVHFVGQGRLAGDVRVVGVDEILAALGEYSYDAHA